MRPVCRAGFGRPAPDARHGSRIRGRQRERCPRPGGGPACYATTALAHRPASLRKPLDLFADLVLDTLRGATREAGEAMSEERIR